MRTTTGTCAAGPWGARQGNLWLSYGITTTRSPGDPVYQMQETREALAHGSLLGPRYFATGEAIDGSRVYYNFMRPTLSLRQLGLEIDRVEGLAYDLVKTYVRLPIEYQRRAIAAGPSPRAAAVVALPLPGRASRHGRDGAHRRDQPARLLAHGQPTRTRVRRRRHAVHQGRAVRHADPVQLDHGACRRPVTARPTGGRPRSSRPGSTTLCSPRSNTATGPAGVTTRALLARQRRHGAADPPRRRLRHLPAPTPRWTTSRSRCTRTCDRWWPAASRRTRRSTTATRNPAKWLNLEDKLGVIKPGAQADSVLRHG